MAKLFIEDLDAARASASSCASTSTSRSRTARSRTTSASRRRCRRSSYAARQGREPGPHEPPRPPRRAAQPEVLARARRRSGSRSCSASRSSSPTTASARRSRQACAALEPGDVVLLENLRFHIEEEGKVKKRGRHSVKADPEAVNAFRAVAHEARRRLRQRRLRHRAPRARSIDGVALAAARRRLPHEEGARLPGRRARQPEAAVRRHPRRREGVGQDRRHQEPAAEGRQARSSAAAWPTPSSRRRAWRSAARSSRTTARAGEGAPGQGRRASSSCPSTPS